MHFAVVEICDCVLFNLGGGGGGGGEYMGLDQLLSCHLVLLTLPVSCLE